METEAVTQETEVVEVQNEVSENREEMKISAEWVIFSGLATLITSAKDGILDDDIEKFLLKIAESKLNGLTVEKVPEIMEIIKRESKEAVESTKNVENTEEVPQEATEPWKNLLKKDLVRDEGKRLKSYRCTAGKVTVGVGRNLEGKGLSSQEKQAIFGNSAMSNREVLREFNNNRYTITDKQSDMLLENDIEEFVEKVKNKFDYFEILTDNQKRALVNMAFNMGLGTLKKFKKMHKALKNGNGAKAKKEALDSRWARQVKSRANRVTDLFLS